MYFSQRALNEIDDSRHSAAATTRRGLAGCGATLSIETTVSVDQPGSADRVDFALKQARRAGRGTVRDIRRIPGQGTVIDIVVEDLHIGVMPFLSFGHVGERRRAGRVRVFWAQTLIASRRPTSRKTVRELVLLGSLDNVVNQAWNGRLEAALKIGHAYPSDPSVLARLVRSELELAHPRVDEVVDSVDRFEAVRPGRYAAFASSQTARARVALCRDQGFVVHWERRPPLARARVVAIVADLSNASKAEADSVVLARPVLIRDLGPRPTRWWQR